MPAKSVTKRHIFVPPPTPQRIARILANGTVPRHRDDNNRETKHFAHMLLFETVLRLPGNNYDRK